MDIDLNTDKFNLSSRTSIAQATNSVRKSTSFVRKCWNWKWTINGRRYSRTMSKAIGSSFSSLFEPAAILKICRTELERRMVRKDNYAIIFKYCHRFLDFPIASINYVHMIQVAGHFVRHYISIVCSCWTIITRNEFLVYNFQSKM